MFTIEKNNDSYLNVDKYMLPRPTRKYCKPILHEDNVEIPIIHVELEVLE